MTALLALVGASAVALAALVALVARARRAGRRRADHDLQVTAREQAKLLHRRRVEHDFAAACSHAADEAEVVELLHDALVDLDPRRPHELHLVDPHAPVLRLVFATGATPRRAPEDASPWESTAMRLGETLVHATTDTPGLCRHLASRLVEHCSAVAVPLVATDRLVGVLYATGPEGTSPSASMVATYEQLARTTAGAIAAIRALHGDDRPGGGRHDGAGDEADDEADDADAVLDLTDRLVLDDGSVLAGRAAAEEVIGALVTAGTPFALLLFDIDGFGSYHARHGAAAGDAALAAMAQGAADALGGAGLFRLDGDHLLVVLADAGSHDALRLVDELRAEITRTVRARGLAAPTVSFGVVEAARGTTVARVLTAVHEALYDARARGNAGTVLGLDTVVGGP